MDLKIELKEIKYVGIDYKPKIKFNSLYFSDFYKKFMKSYYNYSKENEIIECKNMLEKDKKKDWQLISDYNENNQIINYDKIILLALFNFKNWKRFYNLKINELYETVKIQINLNMLNDIDFLKKLTYKKINLIYILLGIIWYTFRFINTNVAITISNVENNQIIDINNIIILNYLSLFIKFNMNYINELENEKITMSEKMEKYKSNYKIKNMMNYLIEFQNKLN